MLDRLGRPAGEALAAGEVVERHRVLGVGFDQLARAVGGLRVLARHVELVERRPDLEAARLEGLPRRPAERDDRCPWLLGEGRSLDARAGEAERAGRSVRPFAVALEPGTALLDEIELLLTIPVVLVVLVDDPVAGFAARPRVDAEGGDPEVGAHGP